MGKTSLYSRKRSVTEGDNVLAISLVENKASFKWEALNKPKEFEGLGFMDVRVRNVCLLVKWIEKLERGDDSLCCSLLRKKYLGQKSIFQIKNRRGSQFCRTLLDLREWYQRGIGVEIRSRQ